MPGTKHFSLIISLTFWKSTIFLIACIIFTFCTPSWKEMFLRYFETKFWGILKLELRPLKLYISFYLHHIYWRRWPPLPEKGYIRPLSSDSSLKCHTFCDTGKPFIVVISEDPWHSHLLPSIWQCSEAANTFFNDLGLSPLGFEYSNFRMQDERFNRLRQRGGWRYGVYLNNT